MARILVVSRDLSSGKVTLPVALLARADGHDVRVVTEGLAAKGFLEEDFFCNFVGTKNHVTHPFPFDSAEELKRINPHLVVTGRSDPNNLEQKIALEANNLGIPTVTIEDTWGGSLQMRPAKPDLLLVVDDYSAGIARREPMFANSRIGVVGHQAKPTEKEMAWYTTELPEIARLRKRYDQIFLYIGGGKRTTDEIRLLVRCLEKTPGNWCLIARYHPKWQDRINPETEQSYKNFWNNLLQPIGDRYIGNMDSVEKTECVTGNSDLVVGSFSNLLVGALAGKTPISFHTETGVKETLTPRGLTETPEVAIGISHEARGAVDLSGFGPISEEKRNQVIPYDPMSAYKTLLSLIK